MPKKNTSEAKKLREQATIIAADIFDLVNQYTHDSGTSKFFLPEEINRSFYITAGGFSSAIYTPPLEADEVQASYALTFFLVLITYGYQIYVRERSLRTNAAPYRLPDDYDVIEKITFEVLNIADDATFYSTPLADDIVDILLSQIERNITLDEFSFKEHTLDKKKLYNYMSLAIYFGYNMAAGLLLDDE